MTHLPFNIYCPICNAGKIRKEQAKAKSPEKRAEEIQQAKERTGGNPEIDPSKFGDLLLCDEIILGTPEQWGCKGETAGLMCKDVGTGCRDLMPLETKSAEHIMAALRDFVGNRHGKISGTVHSDRAKELIAAVDRLRKEGVYNWVHSKAVPHRPTSRGCIEREIGVVFDATRCSLEQSGYPLSWWPKAVRHQCFALNVSDDSWSRARGSAGDNYRFHPAEFRDALDEGQADRL